ncbi:hypothetical protein [Desmonostoc muscorum]|uniref:hypothetical protein n=1 Tax=Desmonostoc muscorum TaxID=1179 RepID=UPI001F26FA4D|nr:hypothetical protein [Desmonostoc muscorum]
MLLWFISYLFDHRGAEDTEIRGYRETYFREFLSTLKGLVLAYFISKRKAGERKSKTEDLVRSLDSTSSMANY